MCFQLFEDSVYDMYRCKLLITFYHWVILGNCLWKLKQYNASYDHNNVRIIRPTCLCPGKTQKIILYWVLIFQYKYKKTKTPSSVSVLTRESKNVTLIPMSPQWLLVCRRSRNYHWLLPNFSMVEAQNTSLIRLSPLPLSFTESWN